MLMTDFTQYFLIILPSLVLANILHMVIVKKDFFSFLNIPVANNYFGKNKTWRGIAFVPILTALFMFLLNIQTLFSSLELIRLGLIMGFAYVIFELPNSFLKRKLGIKPGESSANGNYVFTILDKTDSAFGVALVYYLMTNISFTEALVITVANSLIHFIMSQILVTFKIKSAF